MSMSIRLVVCAAAACAATGTASAAPPNLATSNLNTPAGKMTALGSGIAYQANAFPIGLRVTPPDGSWAGSQWTTTANGKATFGWAAVGHGGTSPTTAPRGVITILTAFGPTPKVSTTIARLRAGGSGTTFQEPSPVTVAGYSGTRLDGNVWGKWGHTFVPFSLKTHGASPSDSWHTDKGEAFRFIVLDVRGKTVVVFLESFGLSADQFPGFLASAGRLLASLQFPA